MKIIAFYLPQFHRIPINDKLWGEGFTEWTNVKRGVPLFSGHEQPVVPLDKNYYNLLEPEVMRWQVKLAKKYGIYGFCFYHYWYNGQLIMEKPIQNYLNDKSLDFPFCICWANHEWSTSWTKGEAKVIFQEDYSDINEWKEHFQFLLPYLKDKRYIQKDGKPLLIIYELSNIPQLNAMIDCWQKLARENGLPGLTIAFEACLAESLPFFDFSRIDYDIEYQPQYARTFHGKKIGIKNKLLGALKEFNWKTLNIKLPKKISNHVNNINSHVIIYDYDEVWSNIINSKPMRPNCIPGAFVKMDTTPRRGERGFVIKGYTPEKFNYYLIKQIKHARSAYHQDMIFMFAWNEWAEGGYLEPDERYKYKALEAIKDALDETGEFPEYLEK